PPATGRLKNASAPAHARGDNFVTSPGVSPFIGVSAHVSALAKPYLFASSIHPLPLTHTTQASRPASVEAISEARASNVAMWAGPPVHGGICPVPSAGTARPNMATPSVSERRTARMTSHSPLALPYFPQVAPHTL